MARYKIMQNQSTTTRGLGSLRVYHHESCPQAPPFYDPPAEASARSTPPPTRSNRLLNGSGSRTQLATRIPINLQLLR
jgi:hypothetical protein